MAKKLGRREKNELKNREIRYLPARSSPLWREIISWLCNVYRCELVFNSF